MKPKMFKSKLKFYRATQKQKKKNKSDRFIAAEIEVSRISHKDYAHGLKLPNVFIASTKNLENVVRKWHGSIVRDGSLPNSGFEINTSPAAGDVYIKQITEICKALTRVDAKINNDCGLHIHIDAR